MIIFHIEDDTSELQNCLMDLLNSKGYSCSVSHIGQNSVVCATKMQDQEVQDAPSIPAEDVPAVDGTLGSFEITDFGAQAIEIGKGISISDADTIAVADQPIMVAPDPEPCKTKCESQIVINEISTSTGMNCFYDPNSPVSFLYAHKIDEHSTDPNQVVATIKLDGIGECRISMYTNEFIISQCANEEPLRNREVDGPVVKVTSPCSSKPFGVILKQFAQVDLDDGASAFCCLGSDLAWLADILMKGEEQNNGEVSAQ